MKDKRRKRPCDSTCYGDLLPPDFGNDEISKRMRRASETYAQWCKRNRPWEWLFRRYRLKPSNYERFAFAALLRAAFDRTELPKERTPNAKPE